MAWWFLCPGLLLLVLHPCWPLANSGMATNLLQYRGGNRYNFLVAPTHVVNE